MQPGAFPSLLIVVSLFVPLCAMSTEWEPKEIVGLSYPVIARSARITGLVIVRLTVGTDGSVIQAEPVSGHPLLAGAAGTNAAQWKFARSRRDGRGGKDPYLVYRFVLEGSCAANDCRASFVVDFPNFIVVTSEMPQVQVSEGAQK